MPQNIKLKFKNEKNSTALQCYKWCLDSESNQGHEDFQSSALPTELSRHSCGGRIWTCGLRVMSPTSFQTALPRDVVAENFILFPTKVSIWNFRRLSGWRWIRTIEAWSSRFTVCPLWPLGNPPKTHKHIFQYSLRESAVDSYHISKQIHF